MIITIGFHDVWRSTLRSMAKAIGGVGNKSARCPKKMFFRIQKVPSLMRSEMVLKAFSRSLIARYIVRFYSFSPVGERIKAGNVALAGYPVNFKWNTLRHQGCVERFVAGTRSVSYCSCGGGGGNPWKWTPTYRCRWSWSLRVGLCGQGG